MGLHAWFVDLGADWSNAKLNLLPTLNINACGSCKSLLMFFARTWVECWNYIFSRKSVDSKVVLFSRKLSVAFESWTFSKYIFSIWHFRALCIHLCLQTVLIHENTAQVKSPAFPLFAFSAPARLHDSIFGLTKKLCWWDWLRLGEGKPEPFYLANTSFNCLACTIYIH